ncbi:MAG: DEAD/DEAH box helicase family protein [Candidatus Gracilibacteria bacterium]|nr:DEAD/DEAH box helicase family protein [Candidatus Gracilibacteria bacterium]
MNYLESDTRGLYIDKKLIKSGYNVENQNQIIKEYQINNLFADYVILDTDNTILAVIEAKKYSRSARDGQFQALDYAQILETKQGYRPFIFLSNGKEIYFYNSIKNESPRLIKSFHTIQDLRKLKELQKMQVKPTSIKINTDISGRHYQQEAIKRVAEGIEAGKREFLLVMATGTGKTRTSMGLIDVMLKSNQVQKVLFLTDRTALRDQAFDDGFGVYFKSTPKSKIETGNTDENARLYSATYQTMINYLDKFSSGFFDLIIIDEVHRSIYGEWKVILEHFDCYKVGLTATPLKFVDRSTYNAFGCDDENPTYYYGYDEAVKEGFLVPYKVLIARTKFQIQGIKGFELPKEILEQLKKEGKDPEEYNFEGTEIGNKIDNKDTNRAIVKEFMEQSYKLEDGLPGKTIIFAMNQKHAENIQTTFEELYPNLNNFSVVITSSVEKNDELLRDFKKLKTEKKFRVAISVDMLDTGVDVPELVNLVFARKVFSESKFWQMVGRGTRLCPGVFGKAKDKEDFLIIDFALNFDETHTFKEPNINTLGLNQRYYESKIELLKLFENRSDKKGFEKTKKEIISMIKSLKENDEIINKKDLIKSILEENIFDNIALNPYEELYKLTPVMRYYDTESLEEIRFLVKGENLKISILKEENIDKLRDSLASDINALNSNNHLQAVETKKDFLKQCLKKDFWDDIDISKIEQIQKELSSIIKYKKINEKDIVISDLKDEVIERRRIQYGDGKQMESDKYWKVFVDQIEYFAKSSKALQKIKNDEILNKEDLEELDKLFKQSEYNITVTNLRRTLHRPTIDFVSFIKFALGKTTLPNFEEEVSKVFESYLNENNFSSNQIRFLQIVKSVLITKKHITVEDFYSDTFEKSFGMGAFERLFKQKEQEKVMELVEKFSL